MLNAKERDNVIYDIEWLALMSEFEYCPIYVSGEYGKRIKGL